MNHRSFEVFLPKGKSKAREATFSWDGSSDELDELLKDATITGKFADSGVVHDSSEVVLVVSKSDSISADNVEADPGGAGSFMVAVILIYGFSIIFLIASQVFQKKKAYYKDTDKNINNYLDNAAQLRDDSKKESFKKLKWSLIPVLAQSPSARTLIAKSVKYTPYLVQYVPFTAVSTSTKVDCEENASVAECNLENEQTVCGRRNDTLSPPAGSNLTFGVLSSGPHSISTNRAERKAPRYVNISKSAGEAVTFAGHDTEALVYGNVSVADTNTDKQLQMEEIGHCLLQKETNV